MSDPPPRGWDTCVVYVEHRQRWWWNAWRPSTCTELHGFADSAEEAAEAMNQAVEQAGGGPVSGPPPIRYRSGELPPIEHPRNDQPREIES
jgi:hypothetical protein